MIEARLKKNFEGGRESRAFSLDVELDAGEGITVLFGPSGSGKTLTLDAIAGFLRPDSGRIIVDGSILYDGEAGVHLSPQARRCGYVFQNYALFPHMTLRENLEFAAAARGKLDRHKRVNEMLERFQLGDMAGRRPHELSGGQKQRGSIARALLADPRLLLLDEPAQGLDAVLRQELYRVLREVRRDFRIPALLVTHDWEEALELGERMHVYREGRIVQSGTPQEVLETPASVEVARMLGIYNLAAAEILSLDPGRNRSRLRSGDWTWTGPYFPGQLIGDRVTVCVHPGAVVVARRSASATEDEMDMAVDHVVEGPHGARVTFAGGWFAELPRERWEAIGRPKECSVTFPAAAQRLLKNER